MIGQTISYYRILNKLGAGGMSEVYLAEDERLGRKLAIKILLEQFTQDAERVRRFEQEARAASALNHPNIITIYEIGQADRVHFIATEFIEGETLRHRMDTRRLSLREAVEIAMQATSALQAAQAAGIVHRDVKPENIMLRPDGLIKLLDFGVSKLIEQPITTDPEGQTRSLLETQPGMVIGTVAYMSPEQVRGQKIDGRTDIFSMGIVLYEMVTGRRPFTGETASDMIAALLLSEPAHLSVHLSNVPPELDRIVSRMLAKDRDARYQSAQKVLKDLERIRLKLEFASESGESKASEAPTAKLGEPSSISSEATPTTVTYATNISPQINTPENYGTNILRGHEIAQASPRTGNEPFEFAVTGLVPGNARKSRRWLLPSLIALAAVLTTALVASWFFQRDARIDSIAVLPFINETAQPDAEYLGEGIAEGIINSLSQLPNMSVSSRNSVIRYKDKEVDAQAAGGELKVKAVLLGRVRRRGDNLMVNTELVNVQNGRQIWGEQFSRKLSDLMALQEEIIRNVIAKLRLRLTDAQQDVLAKRGTQDAEAYDLYLKGRYFWNQSTPEAMKKADEYFEAAATKDSSYALAAAGCAASHAAGVGGESPQESMQKAKLVALKALKLDNNIVEAHLTLAHVNLRYDWSFADAEREFKRAIRLNSKSATAHHRHAEFLALMGRHKEAMNEIRRARSLDPRSLPINSDFGRLSYYAGDYDRAIDHLQKTLELDLNFAPAHTSLGQAYEQKGQIQDAVLEFMRAKRLLRADQGTVTALKKAYAESGREAFWREYLAQLKAESSEHYVPSSAIAALHVRLGEYEEALAALERAYEQKDGGLVELKVEPVFEPLRATTRFSDLLKRVGLSQ